MKLVILNWEGEEPPYRVCQATDEGRRDPLDYGIGFKTEADARAYCESFSKVKVIAEYELG